MYWFDLRKLPFVYLLLNRIGMLSSDIVFSILKKSRPIELTITKPVNSRHMVLDTASGDVYGYIALKAGERI